MASASPPHVVIFPHLAQGHTLPLLDLSKALWCRGLKVTIITTPSNAPSILSKISTHPEICLSVIPFPRVEELPEGCENTAHLPSMDLFPSFLTATKKMKQPFEGILRDMSEAGCLPICVISDFFLGWTLHTCRSFGIPRLVFHGMGVLPMVISKTIFLHGSCNIKNKSDSDPIQLPELTTSFTLTRADFPELHRYTNDDALSRFMSDFGEADADSWGVIVNSFEGLEGDYVAALESFFRLKGAKAWCVGPVLLYGEIEEPAGENQSYSYTEWLDKQDGSGVVIYVSFGTQEHLSDMQMEEIALGLEMAGHPFIWVVKSRTWGPPDGWEERVKEKRGLIVRDWVEQRNILAHPSTGGFLSHCGWNSVLESLSMGVPLLALPMGAEQPLNAKLMVEGLGAGIRVPRESVGGERIVTVGRDVICDGVKELMGGEKGRKAKERAQALGMMARQAVEKGGSSDKKLDELIERLINPCM